MKHQYWEQEICLVLIVFDCRCKLLFRKWRQSPCSIVWSFLNSEETCGRQSHQDTSMRTITDDRNQRQLYKCTKSVACKVNTRQTCAWIMQPCFGLHKGDPATQMKHVTEESTNRMRPNMLRAEVCMYNKHWEQIENRDVSLNVGDLSHP